MWLIIGVIPKKILHGMGVLKNRKLGCILFCPFSSDKVAKGLNLPETDKEEQ